MKNEISLISVSILIILVLNLVLPTISVFAKSEDSSEVITGNYQFSSDEGKNIQSKNTFEYRDDCFTRSSFLGCNHLEILSIQAASASVSYYGSEVDKDEIDPSENSHNITEMLKEMKFEDVSTNKYYTTEKHESSMGVAVGHKNIIQNGKTYTLLAVIPRSAGYKQEWAGNFIVGDGDIHQGYKDARDEILRYLKKYIEDNDIKGNLKIWTAGWSRGAAVTNMLGGFFAGGGIEYFGENVTITPEDVYCYTIGTPRTIKNGLDKNIELSVSGNRTESEYTNDTPGEPYQYTKGGKVSVNDSKYGGIRSIIYPDDAFSLLPLETWGFTYYGKTVNSNQSISSEKEMLEELKSISPYLYNQYTENGKIKQVKRKTFDLKTLSIVDCYKTTTPVEFFKERMKGIENIVKTNKSYNDEKYQDALKSFAGTYGMAATFFRDNSENINIETGDIVYALADTYLAYAAEQLQEEGKAANEKQATSMAIEELLSNYTDEEINNSTFTVDDFIRIFAKYITDNENEPIADGVISGIVSLVPEENKWFLESFKSFDKNNTPEHPVTVEEGLKAYIKACYYGADPECYYAAEYEDPVTVRNLLCLTMVFALSQDIPEIGYIFMDEEGNFSGKAAKFEDAVEMIVNSYKVVKDEEGNVIKTYSSISELADAKIVSILDSLLEGPIEQSGEIYGQEYRNEFENQFNNLKENITEARKIISVLIFYTDGSHNSKEIIENVVTFVDNAMLIPMAHYNEIYLAQARTANRYEDHKTIKEYECIEGNGQTFDITKDGKLSFEFNIDYEQFIEEGKVFVNSKEVSRENYNISRGSTIITFNDEYLKALKEGSYVIIAEVNDGSAQAEFSIAKNESSEDDKKYEEEKKDDKKSQEDSANSGIMDDNKQNPKTGDNIINCVILMIVSLVGIILIKSKKK